MKANTATASSQVSIFYDGACPLCRREINHYRKLDQAGRVRWIDISSNPAVLQQFGLDFATAMSRLHVQDRQQTMHSGVRAFMIVWDALPYYRWLARIIRLTGTAPILEWLYVHFARWRLARRSCDQQTCQGTSQIVKSESGNGENRS